MTIITKDTPLYKMKPTSLSYKDKPAGRDYQTYERVYFQMI